VVERSRPAYYTYLFVPLLSSLLSFFCSFLVGLDSAFSLLTARSTLFRERFKAERFLYSSGAWNFCATPGLPSPWAVITQPPFRRPYYLDRCTAVR
jgi:hypothetical protein